LKKDSSREEISVRLSGKIGGEVDQEFVLGEVLRSLWRNKNKTFHSKEQCCIIVLKD
jgi:hypothetical protein